MKYLTYILLFILPISLVGCQKVVHWFIVENDSDKEIAVDMKQVSSLKELENNGIDYLAFVNTEVLCVNSYDHFVSANSTGPVLEAPALRYWDEFFDEGDTVIFYILDAQMVTELKRNKVTSAKKAILQVYFLTPADLNSLDFKLSYPPKSNLQFIPMLPCYEDAIAGKTLQDIDLEQKE